jgi:N-acetylmuramoyl-L-alanine amidase
VKPGYEFIQSPNCSRRRKDSKISAIVIHYTGSMNLDATIAWFKNPNSQTSAHYTIGRDGRVVQMVRDELAAWHAGKSAMRPDLPSTHRDHEPNVNQFSIGIELIGTHDSGFTDKQMASLYSLVEILVSKYYISPDRIVGHCHLAPGRKIDPDGYDNQFNWAKMREVAGIVYSTITKPVSLNLAGN